VQEIRIRNWLTVFKIEYLLGYYTAVSLKPYGKWLTKIDSDQPSAKIG